MQFCVTRVILRDLAALVPQIFHSLHKITHFLTGYINSYYETQIISTCRYFYIHLSLVTYQLVSFMKQAPGRQLFYKQW
jgi:hypothetical protein